MNEAHRFRFFVEQLGAQGSTVRLTPTDVEHLAVLRLGSGSEVEVVDGASVVWRGRIAGERGEVLLVQAGVDRPGERSIELYAGALVGGKFDELVDGAVQAGATRIIPVAWQRRDLDRLAERHERLDRIVQAAAKQSKRVQVPSVSLPIAFDELVASATPGIVLDASGPRTLDHVVASDLRETPTGTIRLLVGPAEGIDGEQLVRLTDAGWFVARLGPSVLRAELAGAVAVAVAAMVEPGRTV